MRKRLVGLWIVPFLIVLLTGVRDVSAEEVSFSKLFAVQNINIEYVVMRMTERAGEIRASKHRDWLRSSCRNFGSAFGDDFCWETGKRTFHLTLPEFGWAAYELIRPRTLWEFDEFSVRFPPGLAYDGGIKGGISLQQHGKEFSAALELRF